MRAPPTPPAEPPAHPRAVVLVTGSELARGDRRDANGPFLARELFRLGLRPARLVIVSDQTDELAAALRDGLEADICLITGGLGPTHDDRTVELLAEALGRRLVLDERLEREIEAISRRIADRIGRPYADFVVGVRKQASPPEGAVALGIAGTAPALLLEHDERVAVALPGPPSELRRLWPGVLEHSAFRRIAARARPAAHHVLRFFGPSESAIARALLEAGGEGEDVEVTICARELEIHVDLFVAEGGQARAAELEEALRAAFGEDLFAEDDERPVEEIVLDVCRRRRLTLATAESCTGGLVGAKLTGVAGASDVYLGGVVAYSDDVKRRRLGVSEKILRRGGAVSAEAAGAMAAGARTELGADVAVAVTGIAGPGGGTPNKPVGLVFFHAEAPDGVSASSLVLPGDREAIRTRATAVALHVLRRLLTQGRDDRA